MHQPWTSLRGRFSAARTVLCKVFLRALTKDGPDSPNVRTRKSFLSYSFFKKQEKIEKHILAQPLTFGSHFPSFSIFGGKSLYFQRAALSSLHIFMKWRKEATSKKYFNTGKCRPSEWARLFVYNHFNVWDAQTTYASEAGTNNMLLMPF